MGDLSGITPVGASVQSPDVFGTMNSILGLQGKQQALQVQAQQLQQEQFKTEQLSGHQNFFMSFDPLEHTGKDHTVDLDSVHQMDAYKNAGNAKPMIDETLNNIKSGQIKNANDMLQYGTNQLGTIIQGVGSILSDPEVQAGSDNGYATVKGKLDALGSPDQLGPNAQGTIARWEAGLDALQKDPNKKKDLPKYLQQLQAQGLDAQGQIEMRKPTVQWVMTDKGPKAINTNPLTPNLPVGGKIPGSETYEPGITPETRETFGGLARTTPGGGLVPYKGPADTAAPAAPGKLKPIPFPGMNPTQPQKEQYTKTMNEARDHVAAISATANDPFNGTGPTRYRNSEILRLTQTAPTGPGKEIWNHIASQFTGESGDAFQKIGHYLSQNSSAVAKQMGVPGTNLGAETAAAAAGNTGQNPNTIKEVTKVNNALNSALDDYNRGISKLSNNGADNSKVPAFRQAWGQNFDMNVFRYDDAVRNKDDKEITDLHTKLGDDGFKALARKRAILHSLSESGDMPDQR